MSRTFVYVRALIGCAMMLMIQTVIAQTGQTYSAAAAPGKSPAELSHRIVENVQPPPLLLHAQPPVPLQVTRVWTVTNTNDTGAGSLRRAIDSANSSPGLDSISFNIAGTGIHTIRPQSAFSNVIYPIIIDGTTQPGYSGAPAIEIDGSQAGSGVNGLVIYGGNSVVRGLAINRFTSSGVYGGIGIVLDVVGENRIEGNMIGTDPFGYTAHGNYAGIVIHGTSSHNTVGGSSASQRNIISANTKSGITINTGNAGENVIVGNYIGIDVTGATELGNGGNGIYDDAYADTIGGIGAGNTISGNSQPGIYIASNASSVLVHGNIIGLNAAGSGALGNADDGIYINNSSNNVIGGTSPGSRNIISKNYDGIFVNGPLATANEIVGNFVGLDVTGRIAMGNDRAGIFLYAAAGTIVGGPSHDARNIIAGNAEEGIRLRSGASGNLIEGNYIGTDTSGTSALPNYDGIYSKDAHDNTIGGTTSGAGNIISGNTRNGVFLDSLTMNTAVQGNLIGIIRSLGQLVPLGNSGKGISVFLANKNVIGGTLPASGNVIGGNGMFGISITASDSVEVVGNGIGTDGTGALSLGNAEDGVIISGNNNTVGGTLDAQKNYIWYNGGAGVYLIGGSGNFISHNSIQSNTGLGIDIDPPGPNLNDLYDTDGGPNFSQNYPIIDSLRRTASSTTIKGRFGGEPVGQFTLEFYASSKGDPGGYGEGQVFVGSTTITTDLLGNAAFNLTLPSVIDPSYTVAATATDYAGNTSEFSKYLKPLRLTRPFSYELWITEEPDTVAWSLVGAVQDVGIGLSTDGGQTFATLVSSVNASQEMYLTFPPDKLLSKECKIRIWDVAHPDVGDTSALFRIKGFELTRDSLGQYERFSPARHGWSFGNSETNMWPSSWYNQFNYATATDPYTGGRYPEKWRIGSKPQDFPDWPLFVKTFGTDKCYSSLFFGNYDERADRIWYNNSGAWGGSCFGFAISSAVEFDVPGAFILQHPELGPYAPVHDFSMSDNVRLALNSQWTSVIGKTYDAVRTAKEFDPPMNVVNELKGMFRSEAIDTRVLILINRAPQKLGSHALVPYKVRTNPLNERFKWISVYDNNYPDDMTRILIVDSVTNTWTYSPLGWGGTDGLFLADPSADYLGVPPLYGQRPAAKPLAAAAQGPGNEFRILNRAGSSIIVENSIGERISYNDSALVNGMPNARAVFLPTGGIHPPFGYTVPAADQYKILLSNSADGLSRCAIFSDSSIVTFDRANALPSDTDRLHVGAGISFANSDGNAKSVSLGSVVLNGDHQQVFEMNNTGVPHGDSVRLDVVDRLNMRIVASNDSLRFDLHLRYSSAEGPIDFSHANLVLAPNSSAKIVPPWDSMAYRPAKILFDHANSGTYDDSSMLGNQVNGFYCDSVVMMPDSITGGKTASAKVVLNTLAPHGGMLVNLVSGDTSMARVPATVFVAVGQREASFPVATKITVPPESVVITATANSIVRQARLRILPQGIETVAFVPAGGVIGGDSALCTVTLSNPAASGGTLITLTNSNPLVATVPPGVTVPESSISQSFRVTTAQVRHVDSALIAGSSGARVTSGKLIISPPGMIGFSPDTIVGGNYATLVDSIAVPAPPPGSRLDLVSSAPGIASTAPSVTILSGQKKAFASVSTAYIAQDSMVQFSSTNTLYPVSAALFVRAARLHSLADLPDLGCFLGEHGVINMKKFIAGNAIRFNVRLDGGAPQGGAAIRITSDHPALLVTDSSLTVPYQQLEGTFTAVSGADLTAPQQVVVSVSYHAGTVSDTVTIVPRVHYRFIRLSDTSVMTAWAVCANNRGDVLVNAGSTGQPFLWRDGQTTLLNANPGFHLSTVRAINDSGHIAGEVNSHAAIWRNDTTIMLPEPPGTSMSHALALTNDDVVAGAYSPTQRVIDQRACLWSGGGITLLDDLDANHYMVPSAINSSYDIVGTGYARDYTFANAAAMWRNGHIVWSMGGSLTPYRWNEAGSINDSGTVVGSFYLSGWYGSTEADRGWFFRRGSDTTRNENFPPNYGSLPTHINASGDVVGNMWTFDNDAYPSGFLYTQGYYYDLNCVTDSVPPGEIIAQTNWINNSGLIAATVRIPLQNGHKEQACVLMPTGGTVDVKDAPGARIPASFALRQNYPNPFNPSTTIRYELPKAGFVSLKVYNQLGQVVVTLVDEVKPAGMFSAEFNGNNIGSGVYYYRLIAGSYSDVRKMILIK